MPKQADTPPTGAATGARSGTWKTMALVALGVLNAALVLSLFGQHLAPRTAEAAAQPARPSEYIMLPARPIGLNQDVVYILDTDNGSLTAVAYNQSSRTMDFIAPLRLAELFQRGR